MALRPSVRTLLLALAIFAALSQSAAAATFDVYPSPHTSLAAPGTQISFRGGAPATIGAVSVTGSRSGRHTGTLKAHSDGQGASFLPEKPFTPGERVTVRTHVPIAGARQGDYGFTVGEPVAVPPSPPFPVLKGAQQSFASRTDLHPPTVAVTTAQPGTAPGLIFLAPKAGTAQDGPMIIDDRGRLVWFHPIPGSDLATDFRAQTYDGRPVLTWWEGHQYVGDGTGVGVIYDQSYREIARVKASGGLGVDLHEFALTPRGTALITVYQRDRMDLRRYGGPRDAAIVDGIVQEIDIKTGLLLFEWHSTDHVSPAESYVPAPRARRGQWDYFHINSADEDAGGHLIVSGRNSWGIYKLDRATGNVIWRLGGKRSDFKLGHGATTSWQHDARVYPDGTLTVYDNGAAAPGQAFRTRSRAVTLRLDEAHKTATVVSAFAHPRKLLTPSQGDVQRLPNGDEFVGYGSERWFSEYSPAGELLFDGRMSRGNTSYRAYRLPWSGRPADPPRIAASVTYGQVQASASWNGATGVARWVLLAGPSASAMTAIAAAPANGFEATITARTSQPLVAMQAYDASGSRLASTAAVKPAG
jgi:hypothetical protein